ncbi:MAG TPA: hypothetical protein DDZ88_03130 [Verrucomicrobiales bacterium]|nr:hypothetical protein [Verrucomicrobiales bacterium]
MLGCWEISRRSRNEHAGSSRAGGADRRSDWDVAERRLPAAGSKRHSFRGMSTLAEIERAVPHLAADELSHLERLIHSLRVRKSKKQRSAFDLAPVAAWEGVEAAER